jgi:predicted NAD/FAD-binding protein
MNYLKYFVPLSIIYLLFDFSNALPNLNSRIVIIGGGVSGLSAFNELLNYGFKNITILEVENRLGGRIHTIPFSNLC